MARKKKSENSFEEILTNVPQVEETPVEETPAVDIQVDEEVAVEEQPAAVEAPVQVKKETVVFVPFEDFEGRINSNTYNFRKNVAVECTVDEAHTWLDAKKGYIK